MKPHHFNRFPGITIVSVASATTSKRRIFSKPPKTALLAVPAAALMLGAAEAGSTVGLNFQTWYYDSAPNPQTAGFMGTGYSAYNATGFPVTAKAFGVSPANWFNTDPLHGSPWDAANPINEACKFGGASTFAGGLSCFVDSPVGGFQSGSGCKLASGLASWPSYAPGVFCPQGEDEALWGIIVGNADNPFSVSVSGLAAKFPNGYVIQALSAHGGYDTPTSLPGVDFTDDTTTNTATYHTWVIQNSPGAQWPTTTGGLSDPSGLFSANTIKIKSKNDATGILASLAGVIITDQPVVSAPPKNTSIVAGNTLTLTAGAIGLPPITYQWRRNGTPLPGQTNATLTKAGATAGDNGSYDVIATNAYGTTTSDAATVNVAVPVAVTWDANSVTTGAQDGDGTWDSTTSNWWNGSSDIAWSDFNQVTFGAGGTGSYTVTLSGSLNPGSIAVTGTNLNYTLSGSGSITGTGALTKTGTGALTLSTANSYSGGTTVSRGTLQLNNGSAAGSGAVTLGDAATGTDALTLIANAGSATFNNPITVTNSGTGSVTISGNQNFVTFAGAMTLNRPVTLGGTAGDRYAYSGQIHGNVGTLTIDAPRITFNQTVPSDFTGTVVINPGRVLQMNTANGLSAINAVTVNGVFRTIATDPITIGSLNGATTGQMHADSGGGNHPTTVTLGGDNGNGTFNGTIFNGSGGDTLAIVKTGTGRQILSGTNTYTGGTTINNGTLTVSGQISGATTVNAGALEVTGKIAAGGDPIWLKDDTTLTVTASGSGTPAVATTGTFNVGTDFQNPAGMNTLNFAGVNSTTVAPITVGSLFLDSPVTVNILSLMPVVGQYPLLKSDGAATVNSLTLGSLPSGVTATLVDDAAGTIYLNVTAVVVNSLLWTGATNGNWDIGATANWKKSGSPATFIQNDITSFDDSAATTAVTLSSAVNPSILTFSNATANYTLGGSGFVSGFTGLTKTGAGSLTLLTNNTNTGAIDISGGGTVTVGNGGTTGLLGGTGSINLTGSTLAFNRSDDQTLARTIVGTGGTLVKSGTGTLTMNAANNTCDIVVNGGTLVASGGGFSTGFASGKQITVNNASLNTPGFHSMGSSVGGGGDVPVIVLNNSNWLLNHEQYIRSLTLNAGSTSGVPGNDGLRTLSGSLYTVTAAATSSTIGSQLNLFNALTIDVSDGAAANDLVISGAITNSGALTKTGAGTMVLSGANTYTGDTSVNGGILIVGGSSIPNTNKLILNGGKVQSTGTEVVNTLFFGAAQQASGTWGASGSGAAHIDNVHFTGTSGVVSVISSPDFSAWAAANAPGQTLAQDHDNDGVSNGIEYFMGLSGSAFTANPGVVGGKVSWPKGTSYSGVYGTNYTIQTSTNLTTWTDVLIGDPNLSNGNPVQYTLPTGNAKTFSRLMVTGP